ncbi:endonuclease domain-containing protein [Streptomyces sp. NPDC056682]|uniref:endonuclease domain-containing protein n=1 Tax=Streptomyces sp. NPDC056682 TaxID=3345909 RepID=UPI0036C789BE
MNGVRRGKPGSGTGASHDGTAVPLAGTAPTRPSGPAVHVDHSRERGRVPGVMCFNFNTAIGLLGENPDILRRAAAYVEGNSWKPTLVAPGVYQLPS